MPHLDSYEGILLKGIDNYYGAALSVVQMSWKTLDNEIFQVWKELYRLVIKKLYYLYWLNLGSTYLKDENILKVKGLGKSNLP